MKIVHIIGALSEPFKPTVKVYKVESFIHDVVSIPQHSDDNEAFHLILDDGSNKDVTDAVRTIINDNRVYMLNVIKFACNQKTPNESMVLLTSLQNEFKEMFLKAFN